MIHRRFLATLAMVCALCTIVLDAPNAHAWQESHEAYVEVKVFVDEAGLAHFEQAISYRVVRGPLRAFDIEGVEKNAVPEKDAIVTAPDGRELAAHVEVHADGVLRVTVDEPRALMRGTFVFHVKYSADLVAAQELARDGAMWRLSWRSPIATEGFDGGKVVFALPAGPTEPRAVNPDTGNADESILSSLRRAPDHDELELVRPHVARGEAAAWAMRLDPKAFPEVKSHELRPPPPPPPPPPDRLRDVALVTGLASLGALFALLVRHKERAFAAACAARRPLGLVPLGATWRGLLAGVALAGGIALEMAAKPTLGASLVALSILLAAVRAPDVHARPRGPGKWLAILPADAFAVRGAPCHWLDIGGRAGKLTALAAALLIAFGAVASRALDPECPFLVALDALVLLPAFFTGRATQLPPDLARRPARRLRALYRRLQAAAPRRKPDAPMRVVPWARLPIGQAEPDELRLLALPRVAMPGLLGIEVGVAWSRTPNGYDGDLEVLVRVQEATYAAARMTALAPRVRPVPGRREGERVVRVLPRTGTRGAAAALVQRLASELTDRRRRVPERGIESTGTSTWTGAERRVPPNVRGVRAAA